MSNSKRKSEIQAAADILKEKKASLDDLKKEKWVLGVAESVRGQVLGPMVFAACFWPKCYDEIIKKIVGNY